ncbi:unnamed protein product [Callosobruchus maculatus]|uniref:Choline/carnitine acyltransferase domain-containing protein n=1 Tax=Callosobruchus maculatus TaxID=64391 RepID=A0A653DFV3_CALMS|nr:unnamed protein product [Callosobruchus maculatus]
MAKMRLHSKTYQAQEQLPKLPLPPLQNTLKKYEKTLRPLLTEQEHEKVQKIIEKFGGPGGIGVKLQLYLANRREKVDNWVRLFEYFIYDKVHQVLILSGTHVKKK